MDKAMSSVVADSLSFPTMSDIDTAMQTISRGAEAIYAPEEMKKKLESGKQLRIKLGLDPTAPDIHLGHSVVLRKLRQYQDLGHKAVLIIGDYTAKIGDPTGRDKTRPILGDDEIKANAQTYLDQAGAIIDLSEDKFELRYNSDWLANLTFADVLKLTGQVTVNQMLQRDNFKKRMQAEKEIMISEFMYPLMQAWDSVVIEADVELGGTDQTFNCLMGRTLMEKQGMDKQVVVIMPILVGLDGTEKMSKSKGNYIGVTFDSNDMFGKVMSIPDALMPNYFELLTDLTTDRIKSLTDSSTTHPREAKDTLGKIIVECFHDAEAANAASVEFTNRFKEHELPSDIETKTIGESPIGILTLVCSVGFASSNSEARRLVTQGAVSLANEKITDPKSQVTIDGEQVLKVGKRRICKVTAG